MNFCRMLITRKDGTKTLNLPKVVTDCEGWKSALSVELEFNEDQKIIIVKPLEAIMMESNEEIYKKALDRIAVLTEKIAENFPKGDDDVSHYLEKVYKIMRDVDVV